MQQKVLILRYAAYGDFIYSLPVFQHYFDEGWEVHLHTNTKGLQMFNRDPRFTEITHFEPFLVPEPERGKLIQEIWTDLAAKIKPDIVLNLSSSLENTAIATRENSLPAFEMSLEDRRKILEKNFFYGVPLVFAEQDPHLVSRKPIPTLWYDDTELDWGRRWRESHKDNFVILLVLNGSTAQKKFPQAKEWSKELLDRYPDAVIYLCGDGQKAPFSFGNKRTFNTIGAPFRQTALIARYADFVLGPETGVLVSAGMWKTPKAMLCTSSRVYQCCYPHENDFSIQADIDCSPCYRGIYTPADCYKPYREDLCECSYNFDKGKVMNAIELVYRTMRYRREADGELRNESFRMPEVLPGHFQRPAGPDDLRREVPGEVPELPGAAVHESFDGFPVGIATATP